MADETAEQNSDKNSCTETAKSLEYEYATTTTLHGIGRVADSHGARAKITWVIVLLIAGGFYLIVTVDRIQAYLRFDASTNVIIEFNDTLDFPAVTICNYNRYMNSKISESDRKYVKHLLELSDDYFSDDDDDQDFNFTIFEDFNYTQFALTTGFSIKESLHHCFWKGKSSNCDASNFSSYYSPTYGQCFTFNAHGEHKNIQSQQGIGNGLRLIVDISQHQYTETYTNGHKEAGLKFAIHPRDELPVLDTMGLSAAPGFHTYASMRLVHHLNLPKPWGVCGTHGTDETSKYSRTTCLRNCRRDTIIERCNCQPLGYDERDDVQLCDIGQYECVKKALEEHQVSFSASDCTCPVGCTYVTYETTLSMAKFPSQSAAKEILNYYQNDPESNVTDFNEVYVENNLVYLDVYFNELSMISYQQVEALPFTALLGDLGGQLGLFLGASVITGVELLDYIMQRLKIQILKVRAKNKVGSIQI